MGDRVFVDGTIKLKEDCIKEGAQNDKGSLRQKPRSTSDSAEKTTTKNKNNMKSKSRSQGKYAIQVQTPRNIAAYIRSATDVCLHCKCALVDRVTLHISSGLDENNTFSLKNENML